MLCRVWIWLTFCRPETFLLVQIFSVRLETLVSHVLWTMNFTTFQQMRTFLYVTRAYLIVNQMIFQVRWTAPEVLTKNKYSAASDCWSFGVLLYEIFTLGKKPYSGWANRRVWLEVQNGYRLQRPNICPHSIYAMMKKCWSVVRF